MNNEVLFKDSDKVRIVPNLVAECLVDNWYAWAHLINPATASLNVKNRHLKIMNSYIKSPQIHAAAVKNPKMLGGPFIDYGGKRVDEIKNLRDNTLEECEVLLEMADAISELNALLEKEAVGYSLKPLYAKVPEPLKGYVELFYDLNDNASYRFYEHLLYKSKYYKESLQSINLFKIDNDNERSFILSTPSLPSSDNFSRSIPFKSSKMDKLFSTSQQPEEYGVLKKMFDVTDEEEKLFQTFFTQEEPKKYTKYSGDGVLTRYFGHACVLVETKNLSILVDPLISYGYESDISRYTYSDLPDTIDYVLITHNHQDHVMLETLMRIRHKIKHIVVPKSNGGGLQDPGLKIMFQQIGFENIIEIGDLDTLTFDDCTITGVPFLGEHCDLDIRSKMCYLVNSQDDYKILFAADSCNLDNHLYEKIHQIYGDIDVLFLGMECDGAPLSWLYGPLLPKQIDRDKDQTRRLAGCNFEESKAMIDLFKPQNVFVYAMGMEPWLEYISSIKYTDASRPIIDSNRILEYCKSIGAESERLYGEKIIEYKHSNEVLI